MILISPVDPPDTGIPRLTFESDRAMRSRLFVPDSLATSGETAPGPVAVHHRPLHAAMET